jgi:hypothetical protein
MRTRSFVSFSVESAHTRRHAAFGTVAPYDECESRAAVRERSSTEKMPFTPSDRIGRPVELTPPAVLFDELVQLCAADLLVAFDEKLDRHRQRTAARFLQRADREQPRHQMALVVADPTRVQRIAIAPHVERRPGPQVERLRGLHVVVVVQQQRLR